MALFGLLNFGSRGRDNSPAGKLIRYTHMPEIWPRIRALGQKLGHFAYLLALVYRSARLLPAGHPMLNPVNIGRYGVREVIATAANGLVMKRDNTDQILIFGAVLMAIIMIAIQAVLIAFYAFSSPALASTSMFATPSPNTDLAFEFMRNVFGVPNIFGSPAGGAMTIQSGLHAVLGFYSTGMMIIAVLIVVYYVITVVGESAQSGTPFGRRFNGLWAPVRLVLALGLLVPLGSGLNAAQYLTLYVAKFGSSLATNAWITYVNATTAETEVVGAPAAPAVEGLIKSIFAAEACKAAYQQVHTGSTVNVVAAYGNQSSAASFDATDATNATAAGARELSYIWTLQTPGGRISDVTCGSITLDLSSATDGAGPHADVTSVLQGVQNAYLGVIGQAISNVQPGVNKFAEKYVNTNNPSSASVRGDISIASEIAGPITSAINAAQAAVNAAVGLVSGKAAGYDSSLITAMKNDATRRGWASAGIYYVHIARANQALHDSISDSFPRIATPPQGEEADVTNSWGASFNSMFDWTGWAPDGNADIRGALANVPNVFQEINTASLTQPAQANGRAEGFVTHFRNQGNISNAISVVIKVLFGEALLDLVDTTTVDPMSKLIQTGSGILNRSELMLYAALIAESGWIGKGVAFVTGAVATAGYGGVGAFLGGAGVLMVVQFLEKLAPLFWFLVTVGLTAGIILFYVFPLLPFMYFFLATTAWVIEVFEAFISMPLWALAHLRIDGDGMPGQVAMQGYMALLGILLRPILIIFGLIAATLIFGGGATLLNAVFTDVVLNYRGGTSSGVFNYLASNDIGPFGFVVYVIIYVYVLYMFAISAFKLMDMIPDKALRWLNGPTPFTGDKTVDVGNMQSVAIAGFAAGSGLGNAMQKTMGGFREDRQAAESSRRHSETVDAIRSSGGGTGGGTPRPPTGGRP